MALNREAIDVALLARLILKTLPTSTPAGPIKAWQRRYESWTDTPPSREPAGMLIRGTERPVRTAHGTGLVWHLDRWLLVYARDSGVRDAIIDSLFNQIATSIEAALEMQPGEIAGVPTGFPAFAPAPAPTTLGGIVESCSISGAIETYEGTAGHDGFLKIPIEIVATV